MAAFRDLDIGASFSLRGHITRRYFAAGLLGSDHRAVHPDRDRARDVIRYAWNNDRVAICEHDTIEISNRSGYPGSRTPTRVEMLADPTMSSWIATALALIPPPHRQPRGTFGMNLMRTRNEIVSGPHRDDEEYVFIYVINKVGGGAVTTLHPEQDPATVAYRAALEPGDMLVFRDDLFLHDVTPLTATGPVPPHRDVLVCTVDYSETYGPW